MFVLLPLPPKSEDAMQIFLFIFFYARGNRKCLVVRGLQFVYGEKMLFGAAQSFPDSILETLEEKTPFACIFHFHWSRRRFQDHKNQVAHQGGQIV